MDEHRQGVAMNGARAESTSEQGWGKDEHHCDKREGRIRNSAVDRIDRAREAPLFVRRREYVAQQRKEGSRRRHRARAPEPSAQWGITMADYQRCLTLTVRVSARWYVGAALRAWASDQTTIDERASIERELGNIVDVAARAGLVDLVPDDEAGA